MQVLSSKAVHAAVAMNKELRIELLQGLCLFKVAAHRALDNSLDAVKAAEIVQLIKERVQQSIAEVQLPGVLLRRRKISLSCTWRSQSISDCLILLGMACDHQQSGKASPSLLLACL